jgi:proteic killer suppression protein
MRNKMRTAVGCRPLEVVHYARTRIHRLLPPDVWIRQNDTLDVTHTTCYSGPVIVSYRDSRTRDFAAGKWVKAFSGFDRSARLKLDRLEAAVSLRDLSVLPGSRFEVLLGDRKGQFSIRINDQWRICFEWPDRSPGPSNVEIVDYH